MNNFKFPKLGLRTIKSGIAVFFCLLLWPAEPFFACLTAVICLQDTVYNSIHMGINRGAGTILGASFGLVFLSLFRTLEYHISNQYISKIVIYIIISLGIIFMIYLCNLLKRPGAINITCIAFLGVTTAHAYSDPLYYATNRIIETLLGIVISILVNKLITPPPHK
ncbi:MAG: FUSC family protein [Clostridium sp.]|jgi:uncharacterized membrane protein YgaE (UPF0421/DUF939 family)|nr:FUSC family protein [Clostridium sp.]